MFYRPLLITLLSVDIILAMEFDKASNNFQTNWQFTLRKVKIN